MRRLGGVVAMIAAAILALAGVLIARTLTIQAPPLPVVALQAAPKIDRDLAAQRLARTIQVQTISVEPGTYDVAAFDALHAILRDSYPLAFARLTVEQPAGHSLMMTWPGSDPALPPIVLLAHQDVVPVEPGTEGGWDAPPFSGALKDGFIYGRGALDDKGSLIGILEAVEALLKQGFTPRRTVILAFGHDEEVMGAGASAMAARLKARGLKAWFVLDEGMAIITDFPLTGAPASLIGIAEKGYLTVRVTAKGAGGHSSTPPREGAAEKLAAALLAIDKRPFKGSLSEGPAGMMVRTIAAELPFTQRLALANLWLFGPLVESQLTATPAAAALLATTTAPTILGGGSKENVLPQEVWAIVNLRLHPRDSIESALTHLRSAVADIEGVAIEPLPGASEPSPVSSATSDSFALLSAVAREAAPGAPVAPMLVLGATDARHYRAVAENIYRFSPMAISSLDTARIHGTNERISVENVGRLGDAYTSLILNGAR